MDGPQKMHVVDWQDSPLPVSTPKSTPRRFLSPTLFGALGTVLLHAVVIQSIHFASWGHLVKLPETPEYAGAPSKSKANSEESLVLITLPMVPNSIEAAAQNLISSFPDMRKMQIQSSVDLEPPALLNMEALALSEDQAFRPQSGSGEGGEQARLRGIYTGQIMARIDRVWRRPRTSVKENPGETVPGDSFQCEAQVIQDAVGYVQEILLPRCNGSPAWQHSLVTAIRQASPLPAPPDPAVFRRSITLQFIGIPFVPGASDDDYETVPRETPTQRLKQFK
jgi:hypothetical protein